MPIKQKISGGIRLFRPELALAAGLCVVIGEMLALGAFPPLAAVGLGFVCGLFLSGSALITNDYFDLEVDRINAPQRPLPAGLLTPPAALVFGLGTGLIGLAAAWVFNPLTFGLGLLVWLMGLAYNWKLKAAGLWGNLIVSASVAMTFILGGIAVGQALNKTVWAFGLIAFVFDLAEEIAADAMDAEGDQKRASKSIALVYGKQTALRLAGVLLGLDVLITLLPLFWLGLDLRYLFPISFIDLLILFFGMWLVNSHTPAEGRWAIRGLYLSASVGLLAFLLGSVFAL